MWTGLPCFEFYLALQGQPHSNKPTKHLALDLKILYTMKINEGSLDKWLLSLLSQERHKASLGDHVPECTEDTEDDWEHVK